MKHKNNQKWNVKIHCQNNQTNTTTKNPKTTKRRFQRLRPDEKATKTV